MAKTNFSGPITAGKINNTTGVLPSVDVRNTGFVTMAQSFAYDFNLFAVDDDGIATAAANPAGQAAGLMNLTNTVDGTAASGSFVLPGNGIGSVAGDAGALAGVPGIGKVAITSTANDAGRTFTIVGTDLFGNSQTEGAITGPNGAATVQSTSLYRTITSITVAGGVLVGNVRVGYTCVATATEAVYQLKSLYNVIPNGETPATSNKNLANNINIPARSRIINWRLHLGLALNQGGNCTFGFGTSSANATGVPTIDLDYFTPTTASLKQAVGTLDYAGGMGTLTAVQAKNFQDVSSADTPATSPIDKEILLRVVTLAGTAATAGNGIITVEYAQSVNSVRSN